MRTLNFNSRLFAATAISLVMAAPAYGQDYGLVVSDPTPVTNPIGTTIYGVKRGMLSTGPALFLDNAGIIRGDVFDGITISGGPAQITNSGSISGNRFGITTIDFYNEETGLYEGRAIGSSITNSGSIIGDTNDGIRLIGGGTVTNSGYIAGRVGALADGISMFTFADQPLDSFVTMGSVFNLVGGVIEGNRFGVILSNGGSVTNAGIISGNAGSVLIQAQLNDPGRTGSVTNSGMLNGELGFNNLTNVFVDNSGTITSPTSGIRHDSTMLTLNNSGTIRGDGMSDSFTGPDAGILLRGGTANIANSGIISGANFGITTSYGISDATGEVVGLSIGSSITNSGSIIGDTNDGIRLIGGGTVTNSGYIAGRVGALADGISMFSYDDQPLDSFVSIGSVANLVGGVIDGNRFGVILSNGGSVTNAGTISGNSGGITIQAQSIDPSRTGTVTNGGTINGGVRFANLLSVSVDNSGQISNPNNAGIFAAFGNGPLTVANHASGSIVGATSGILSLASGLSLVNDGTIRGNGGYDGYNAAPDGGIDFAGGPADILNNGTISGQRFGITSAYIFNPSTSRLEGRATWSTITNNGSIIGDTDAGIRLIGGGTVTNSGYIAGRVGQEAAGITMFEFGGQDMTGRTGIGTVTNLAGGVIEGARNGVELYGGGSITNAGRVTGTINSILIQGSSGQAGRVGAVTNSGILNGSVTLANLTNASVENSGVIQAVREGVSILSPFGDFTITNLSSGRIMASQGYGIYNAFNTNNILLNNAGAISSADDGIFLGSGTIRNSGTITAANGSGVIGYSAQITNSGTISGLKSGLILSNSSTIENSGLITGNQQPAIHLGGGGTVTNSGRISNLGSPGVAAIYMPVGGTLNNSGVIGGTKGSTSVAALLAGNATLVNDGKINGRVVISGTSTANIVINNAGRIDLGSPGYLIGDQSVPKAIKSDAPTTLTIAGGVFNPIQLSGFADTVTLAQGSTTSWIDTGGGQDVVQLTGTANATNRVSRMPYLDGVEVLRVAGGYWFNSNGNSFGWTTIGNGTLELGESLAPYSVISPISVNLGGTLASRSGSALGNVFVNNGGTIAPGGTGGPISTLSVTGNVYFGNGSFLAVDTTPTTNNSDRLNVTGAAIIDNGAALQILAGKGKYTTSSYTILTATGGITGMFGTLTTDMAFLTPQVTKSSNNGSLVLNLTYNKKPLTVAATADTVSLAAAISSYDPSNPIYQSVLGQSLDGATRAFDSLSGGSFGRLDAALLDGLGRAELTLGDTRNGTIDMRWSDRHSLSATNLKSGFAFGRGPVSVGTIAGHYIEPIHVGELYGQADTSYFGAMLAYRSGGFRSLVSAATANHDVSVTRTVSFPGFVDRAASRYRATTNRIDFESAYALADSAFKLAPYVGYSHLMLRSKALTEQGGFSALDFGRQSRTISEVRLGVRTSHKLTIGGVEVAPYLNASLERAFGDLASKRDARFAFSEGLFDSVGFSFNRRRAMIDAGADVTSGNLSIGAGYRGQLGDRWNDHSARITAALRF